MSYNLFIVPDELANLPSKAYKIEGIGEIFITENDYFGMFEIIPEKVIMKLLSHESLEEKSLTKIEVGQLLSNLNPEVSYITSFDFFESLKFDLSIHNIGLSTTLETKWSFEYFKSIPTKVKLTHFQYFSVNNRTYIIETDNYSDSLKVSIDGRPNAIEQLNTSLIKLTQREKNIKLITAKENGRF